MIRVPGTGSSAREFYGGTLGLPVDDLPMPGGLLSIGISGGRSLMLYPKPDFTPATASSGRAC